ncbi:MAG: hypothetical protein ABIF40_00495 [archaeon]
MEISRIKHLDEKLFVIENNLGFGIACEKMSDGDVVYSPVLGGYGFDPNFDSIPSQAKKVSDGSPSRFSSRPYNSLDNYIAEADNSVRQVDNRLNVAYNDAIALMRIQQVPKRNWSKVFSCEFAELFKPSGRCHAVKDKSHLYKNSENLNLSSIQAVAVDFEGKLNAFDTLPNLILENGVVIGPNPKQVSALNTKDKLDDNKRKFHEAEYYLDTPFLTRENLFKTTLSKTHVMGQWNTFCRTINRGFLQNILIGQRLYTK